MFDDEWNNPHSHCLLSSDDVQFFVPLEELMLWSPIFNPQGWVTHVPYPSHALRAALDLLKHYKFPEFPRNTFDSLRSAALLARMVREMGLVPAIRRLTKGVEDRLRDGSIHVLLSVIIATHLRDEELVVMCIQCRFEDHTGERGWGGPYWAPPLAKDEVCALFPQWAECALTDALQWKYETNVPSKTHVEADLDSVPNKTHVEADLEKAERAFRDCSARWKEHGFSEEGPVGSIGVPWPFSKHRPSP
ncbi:uncharacterized protein CcaverHIS019_0602220 [Cutaneotrichosporon cavernicola]|uniref:Uncharacterized protein n=1 Tax=Cutaneotrichosporon cavernicola TaxID=279322 RepID=A0AA48L8D2_9TREE|nr:uncharacterized protein CcaverHIS019_0602220 [Cutaneotrichosporon cavernicola]BEI93763.1 hypothetical protein CcaverHIS019_0602220 [Cutaneotrichosporon cavernicola]